MERAIAITIFWILAIVIGLAAVWIMSRITKEKVTVDLYAAINCFLYFAFLFNVYIAITDQIYGFITVIVIGVIIFIRKSSSGRWI